MSFKRKFYVAILTWVLVSLACIIKYLCGVDILLSVSKLLVSLSNLPTVSNDYSQFSACKINLEKSDTMPINFFISDNVHSDSLLQCAKQRL